MNYDGLSKYDRKVAEKYDADRQGEAHWRAEYEWLLNYAKHRPLGRVLDLPVGTGRLLSAMSSANAIVGVDVSEDMLRVARDAANTIRETPIELTQGDALHLAFEDAAFDTVVCFRLAHLIPPELIPPLLAELSRVSSGRILLQIYAAPMRVSRSWPMAWLVRQVRHVFPRRKLPWSHITSYQHTWEFFQLAFQTAGLKITHRHHLCAYAGSSVDVIELSK